MSSRGRKTWAKNRRKESQQRTQELMAQCGSEQERRRVEEIIKTGLYTDEITTEGKLQ
jgi:hypothetical protein